MAIFKQHKMDINKLIGLNMIVSIFYYHLSAIYLQNSILDNIKYLLVAINISICIIDCIKSKRKLYKFKLEFQNILIAILCFAFLSFYYTNTTQTSLTFRTYLELFFLFLPAVYAFFLLNTLKLSEIDTALKIIMISSIILWVVEIGPEKFTISNFMEINFFTSYSPFESHIFADTSLVLFCYFLYTQISKKKNLRITWLYYLSFFFVIMTFKRIPVMFSIVLFILNVFMDLSKRIKSKTIFLTKICFILFTLSYLWLLKEDNASWIEKIINFDLDKFTVGRQWYLSLVEGTGFRHGPYGGTSVILENMLGQGKYLEMDLVKIAYEMGFIGLVVFINSYWNIIEKNRISFLIMIIVFGNLLLSHSLTNPFAWSLRLIVFGYIIYDSKKNREETNGKTCISNHCS